MGGSYSRWFTSDTEESDEEDEGSNEEDKGNDEEDEGSNEEDEGSDEEKKVTALGAIRHDATGQTRTAGKLQFLFLIGNDFL